MASEDGDAKARLGPQFKREEVPKPAKVGQLKQNADDLGAIKKDYVDDSVMESESDDSQSLGKSSRASVAMPRVAVNDIELGEDREVGIRSHLGVEGAAEPRLPTFQSFGCSSHTSARLSSPQKLESYYYSPVFAEARKASLSFARDGVGPDGSVRD